MVWIKKQVVDRIVMARQDNIAGEVLYNCQLKTHSNSTSGRRVLGSNLSETHRACLLRLAPALDNTLVFTCHTYVGGMWRQVHIMIRLYMFLPCLAREFDSGCGLTCFLAPRHTIFLHLCLGFAWPLWAAARGLSMRQTSSWRLLSRPTCIHSMGEGLCITLGKVCCISYVMWMCA